MVNRMRMYMHVPHMDHTHLNYYIYTYKVSRARPRAHVRDLNTITKLFLRHSLVCLLQRCLSVSSVVSRPDPESAPRSLARLVC